MTDTEKALRELKKFVDDLAQGKAKLTPANHELCLAFIDHCEREVDAEIAKGAKKISRYWSGGN